MDFASFLKLITQRKIRIEQEKRLRNVQGALVSYVTYPVEGK